MNAIAEIGHNNPPLDEVLPLNHADLLSKAKDLAEQFGRAPDEVKDNDGAEKATLFIKSVNSFVKEVDGVRVDVKQPFLDGGRAVDGFFKAIEADMKPIVDAMKKRLTAYQVEVAKAERAAREAEEKRLAEEARMAQEEADRIAASAQSGADIDAAIEREAEAAEKIAAAQAQQEAAQKANKTTAVNAGAAKSSLRMDWVVKSVDKATVDLETLRPFLAIDALEKAARAYVKAGNHSLKGAVIVEEAKSVIR